MNWVTREVEWVVFEDVRREAREVVARLATGEPPESCANIMWEQDCYDLELYVVEGRTVTQAEAFEAWAKQGFTRTQCLQYWGSGVRRAETGDRRDVDPAWKRERRERLMTDRGLSSPAASSATPTAPK